VNITEATIDIAAPPAVVWSVLTEWTDYPDWNPFITGIEGRAAPGQSIFVRIRFGRGSVRLNAKVTRVIPGAELAWHARLPIRGLFDRDHVFRIDTKAGGCRLRQTQTFFGILCPILSVPLRGTVRRGLVSMNTSIKRRAETIARSPRPLPNFLESERSGHLT
jgi:hypothetical protein